MDQLEYETRKAELQAILSQYSPEEIYKLLVEWVEPHTRHGVLRHMVFDRKKPYHQLQTVMLPPAPIPNSLLAPYGPRAHKAFSVILNAWLSEPMLVAVIAALLHPGGENVCLVTDHGNIIDIALVLGALRLVCEKYISAEEFSERSTLIISRGISATELALPGSDPTSSVEMIQFMAHVLMSFPTTLSRRERNFPAELVRASNDLTQLEINYWMDGGGRICAFAPSSSEDRLFSNKMHLQPLKNGTMDMMQRGLVVPVAVTIDPPHNSTQPPACKILTPRRVKSYPDCHAVMHEIAEECHRQTLVPHVYHEDPTVYEKIFGGRQRRTSR